MLLSGVCCFLLEKDWFTISPNRKVPMYMMLSVSLCFSVSYTAVELLKCVAAILVAAHWFGCLWSLQASLFSESVLDSWLGNYGYCLASSDLVVELPELPADDGCPAAWDCRPERPGVVCKSDGTLEIMLKTGLPFFSVASVTEDAEVPGRKVLRFLVFSMCSSFRKL